MSFLAFSRLLKVFESDASLSSMSFSVKALRKQSLIMLAISMGSSEIRQRFSSWVSSTMGVLATMCLPRYSALSNLSLMPVDWKVTSVLTWAFLTSSKISSAVRLARI